MNRENDRDSSDWDDWCEGKVLLDRNTPNTDVGEDQILDRSVRRSQRNLPEREGDWGIRSREDCDHKGSCDGARSNGEC